MLLVGFVAMFIVFGLKVNKKAVDVRQFVEWVQRDGAVPPLDLVKMLFVYDNLF